MTDFRVPELSTYEWQQSVLSVLADPPVSPSKGDRYIIAAAGASGDWTGRENEIAWCSNATGPVWTIDTLTDGSIVWNEAISAFLTYNGAAWTGNWEVSTGRITAGGNQMLYDASVDGFTASMFIGGGGESVEHTTAFEGYYNMSVGPDALRNITKGGLNIAVGSIASGDNTTGNFNTAIGAYSLVRGTTGSSNTGIGYSALSHVSSGTNNVGIGYNSGRFLSDGSTEAITLSSCVYIGADTKASANTVSNETAIGTNAVGSGSNTVTIGGPSNTDVYLTGNITPSVGYKSSDGSTGATASVAVAKVGGGTRTLNFKNGLYIDYTDS